MSDEDPSSRVHEVIVHISYSPHVGFTPDDLLELRDYTEAIVGREFSLEQSRVDMRIRSFGELDEYTEPLFIRVIAQHDPDPLEQKRVTVELESQIAEHFHTPFRLWVEFAVANFSEVTNP